MNNPRTTRTDGMGWRIGFFFAAFLVACVCRAGYVPEKPAYKVGTILTTWQDAKRDREVPVEIYYPEGAKGPCPLIIFSHGLGGSRFGYAYLGEHWAGCGYISVHLQHHGSDDALWRGAGFGAFAALTRAVADPKNAVNRAEDVKFAIDRVLALDHQPTSPLDGLVDKNEIGMAGHSFGAWTTLAVVGEKNPAGIVFTDPRIKAAIAMSPPVPGGAQKAAGQFTAIKVPVFHMTGTRDNSPIGETQAADRRIPFDQATTPGTCLLILNGADHMTFSGHLFPGYNKEDVHFQKYVLAGSTAFWDATLRGNGAARDWLYHGGFAAMLGKEGTFEGR
ncbi:MAG TPA: dienelactone hydrolase [Chthoniobacteraceae bacterium]|nr:dienelactone hydrolase [Chthoniobacteraceae bacterium]